MRSWLSLDRCQFGVSKTCHRVVFSILEQTNAVDMRIREDSLVKWRVSSILLQIKCSPGDRTAFALFRVNSFVDEFGRYSDQLTSFENDPLFGFAMASPPRWIDGLNQFNQFNQSIKFNQFNRKCWKISFQFHSFRWILIHCRRIDA